MSYEISNPHSRKQVTISVGGKGVSIFPNGKYIYNGTLTPEEEKAIVQKGLSLVNTTPARKYSKSSKSESSESVDLENMNEEKNK